MRVVAIIQARMGSTRLPGKVLKPFGRHPVLTHVLRRVASALPHVVLAVPYGDWGALHPVATAEGLVTHCGPEENALERYWRVALATDADIVVRVTADCPLISPDLITRITAGAVANPIDYCRTALSEPRGLDVEAFSSRWLGFTLSAPELQPGDLEHVTPYIQRQTKWLDAAPKKRMRWTLDTEEDYAWFCRLAQHVNTEPPHPTTEEVLDYIAKTGDVRYEPEA